MSENNVTLPTAGKPTVKPKAKPTPKQSGEKPAAKTGGKKKNPEADKGKIEKPKKVFLMPPPVDDGKWHPTSFDPNNVEANVRIPLALTGDPINGKNELDIRKLTPKQSLGVMVLMEGLSCDGAQTADGNEITSRQQAVKKLLEMLADEFAESDGEPPVQ